MRSSTLVRLSLQVSWLALVAAGCVGRVDDSSSATDTPAASRPGSAGSGTGGRGMTGTSPPTALSRGGRLRRLTSAQFRNTLRDLLGDDVTVGAVEPDSLRDG